MRHRTSARKLNRTSSHRKALLKNMANSLLNHEQIITTLPKAKTLRPYVEKLITFAKKGGLHSLRQVISKQGDQEVVKKLFSELKDRYQTRNGGYTRILKAGFRYGDSAPMAVIELVDRNPDAKGKTKDPIEFDSEAEAK